MGMQRSSAAPGSTNARRVLAAVVALVVCVTAPAAGGLEPARPTAHVRPTAGGPVQADGDWLRFEHRGTWDVDMAAQAVRVRHELRLTNQQPDQRVPGGVRYTFLPEIGIPVPAGVVGLAATRDDGRPLSTHLEPSGSGLVEMAVIDLSPDLRFGDTQTVIVTYDLPSIPPRSESPVRVNRAYVGFPILIDGDPGLTSAEVRVPLPFVVEVVGDEMEVREEAGVTILSVAPDDPTDWFASVVARDDGSLLSRTIDVGEHDVVVRAWPDDPEWADFAASSAEQGVPVLEDLIGLPWPATRDVEVLETASPYLYGYAGWYQPMESVIEVGDALDARVMLHELSHLWFNAQLFTDRWINEGLAEVFSSAAGDQLGHPAQTPEPIDPTAPGALALNDWAPPDLTQDISAEQEEFGYNAAWSVMAQVVAETGIPALAEIVDDAANKRPAYQGPGTEALRGTFAWTQLLDLLEDRAGSTTAADLFARHVVNPVDQDRLVARSAGRARYAAHRERGGDWEPPVAVRMALSNWRFDEALELMDQAEGILDVRDDVIAAVEPLGAEPRDLEATYETAEHLAAAEDEAQQALAAARQLSAASRSVDRPVGPVGAVGLLFTRPEDQMDAAVEAFEEGDYRGAEERAAAAAAQVEGATRTGGLRLGAATAVVITAVLVRRRRRRGGTGPVDSHPDDVGVTSPWAPQEPLP